MKQNYWLNRVKKKKGFVYYYRLNRKSGLVDEDETTFHSTHQSSRAMAKLFVENLIAEKKQEDTNSQLSFKKYAVPFFIWETCPRVDRRLNEGKSIGKTHVQKSRRWLEMYVFDDPFASLRIDKIKRSDILNLRERLKEKTGINTINKVISTVKTVLSEAYFREDILHDPGSRIGNISYQREEKGILIREELSLLFKDIPGVWDNLMAYCVFNVAAKTGMRCSEVLALEWNSLDFSEYTIDIYQAWKDKDTLGLPKSNKKRKIPVVYSVVEPIKASQEESVRTGPEDLVFCYDDGSRLSVTYWKNNFKKALNKAGLDWKDRNLTPHSLRHSLNSHLLAAGADPIKIRGYFGWSDNLRQPILTPVQAGYTHWQPESLKNLLPIIDKIFSV